MWQFPLKAWEPENHPNLTDVSLRQVGWVGGGRFPKFPTGSQDREPLAEGWAPRAAPRAATSFGPIRELVAAINACCRHRGDTEANRTALIAECGALSPRQQREMADHFETEARAWARATGANTDFSNRRAVGNS